MVKFRFVKVDFLEDEIINQKSVSLSSGGLLGLQDAKKLGPADKFEHAYNSYM